MSANLKDFQWVILLLEVAGGSKESKGFVSGDDSGIHATVAEV